MLDFEVEGSQESGRSSGSGSGSGRSSSSAAGSSTVGGSSAGGLRVWVERVNQVGRQLLPSGAETRCPAACRGYVWLTVYIASFCSSRTSRSSPSTPKAHDARFKPIPHFFVAVNRALQFPDKPLNPSKLGKSLPNRLVLIAGSTDSPEVQVCIFVLFACVACTLTAPACCDRQHLGTLRVARTVITTTMPPTLPRPESTCPPFSPCLQASIQMPSNFSCQFPSNSHIYVFLARRPQSRCCSRWA